MFYQILFLVVLVALSAIFSGSETAFMSIPPSKVKELYSKRVSGAKILKKLKDNPHRLLITILIGNNVVNITASAYTAVLLTGVFGSSSVGITTGIMTFLILVFGEITPKAFAHGRAVKIALLMARPMFVLEYVMWPLIMFFELMIKGVNLVMGRKKDVLVTEDELVAMVKLGAEEGAINKEERQFIENILEFNDIFVKEVMVPRVDVEALEENATLAQAAKMIEKSGHSRIPVYRGNLDHIVGIVNVKDIFKYIQKYNLNKKLKTFDFGPLLKVPFSKKINVLFREFQKTHIHMAVVIDEYGGTAGVVAMEDLLEEIVGEIADEFDEDEKAIEVIDKNSVLALGDVTVGEINNILRTKIGNRRSETLNALILRTLGRFPHEGEIIHLGKSKIKVLQTAEDMVKKVRIRRK